jgi:hypothetical protein
MEENNAGNSQKTAGTPTTKVENANKSKNASKSKGTRIRRTPKTAEKTGSEWTTATAGTATTAET